MIDQGSICADCGKALMSHPYAKHADGRRALECPTHGTRDSLNTVYATGEALTESDPLALTQENFDWALARIGVLTERCEASAAREERLREALRYYAEPSNYVYDHDLQPEPDNRGDVLVDGGQRAREAVTDE